MPILAHKMQAFAAFNNCEGVTIEVVVPDKIKETVVKALDV